MKNDATKKHIDPRYKIGMRNIKTALSVGICILFFQFVGIGDGIQASIAAIICMKSSLQNSIQTGVERIIGTIIGSVLGTLALLLIEGTSYQISTLIAITGVVLIIYLCNVFKVQASTVIGLVVFLIILIGKKDMPPIGYGAMRLTETFFGIAVAYLVNRFFDPKHLRRNFKNEESVSPNIRPAQSDDLPKIMAIWLESNIVSHPAIGSSYWHEMYDSTRTAFDNSAKVFIYEDNAKTLGFISISDDREITAINADIKAQGKKVEEQLLYYCQEMFPCLAIKVFTNNENLVELLTKSGFSICGETIDPTANVDMYSMEWSDKSDTLCNV